MRTLLLIGLIYAMLITLYRLVVWLVSIFSIKDEKFIDTLKLMNISKTAYIIGGIEHIIILASILAATIIIY